MEVLRHAIGWKAVESVGLHVAVQEYEPGVRLELRAPPAPVPRQDRPEQLVRDVPDPGRAHERVVVRDLDVARPGAVGRVGHRDHEGPVPGMRRHDDEVARLHP